MIPRIHETKWHRFDEMPITSLQGISVHRLRPSHLGFPDSARGAVDLFRTHAACRPVAKSGFPFHVVIEPSGWAMQTAPLNARLWHDGAVGNTHLGIACISNSSINPMQASQRASLMSICAGLVKGSEGHIRIADIREQTQSTEGAEEREKADFTKALAVNHLRLDIEEALEKGSVAERSAPMFAWDAKTFNDNATLMTRVKQGWDRLWGFGASTVHQLGHWFLVQSKSVGEWLRVRLYRAT